MVFWSSETWKSPRGEEVVSPFDKKRVSQGSYELTLGAEYVISSADATKKVGEEGEQVCIPPGQFALLTTYEKVTIPLSSIGWISIKFKYKLRGLVNISGLHVDPGFSNRLKFSVYNAAPTQVVLTHGEPVFLLWLAQLDGPTADGFDNKKLERQWPISDFDVMNMSNAMASPAQLRADMDALKEKIDIYIRMFWAVVVGVGVVTLLRQFIE